MIRYMEQRPGRPLDDGYRVTCDKQLCYLGITVNTMDLAADLERNHTCPHPGGMTRYSWEITMTLVEAAWAAIDREYELLATEFAGYGEGDAPRATQKGKLRGMAEIIQLFMSPHFRTTDEVVREVVKRKQMRDSGESYDTPGIGSRRLEMPRYEPSDAHKETQTKRASIQELNARGVSARHVTPKAKPQARIVSVDAETRAAILGLKDFAEANEVATIYGCAVEDVETIWAK